MKPTLVILAAGMASRYGSMKQVESFGPAGETIMDYSIYDAIRAGFGKVVFIIRAQHGETFRSMFEPKLADRIQTEYVYQELDLHTGGYAWLPTRTKPWGTAHAVLCAKEAIGEPFAVINADDFYGRHAFEVAAEFLSHTCSPQHYAIVGYSLPMTLTEHGTVNRGVCKVDETGKLISITERLNIANEGGRILAADGIEPISLSSASLVSMNFWCFNPGLLSPLESQFHQFLLDQGQVEKSEFFIPLVADGFIQQGGVIEVLPTTSTWFGVTYKADAPAVQASLNALIQAGEYPNRLWKN